MIIINSNAIEYILELLNISVTTLSQNIFVEQSLVSKWKNGTRTLKKESPHYKNILDYCIRKNIENNDKTLENFFLSLYPDSDVNESDHLKNCLNAFLCGNDISLAAEKHHMATTNALYNSNFYVYKNLEGRQNAMRLLLDTAESIPMPSELYILDCEQFSWITEDAQFFEEWDVRMKQILDTGTKIFVVHFIHSISPHYKILYGSCSNIFCHQNMTTYYFTRFSDDTPFFTHYVLKGHMAMVGLNLKDKQYPYYTAIYTDPFTCHQLEGYIKSIMSLKATKRSRPKTENDKLAALSFLTTFDKSNEPLYISGKIPNMGFMSDELISEILISNNVTTQNVKICKKYQVFLREIMDRKDSNYQIKHFYYIEDFEQTFEDPTIINAELSGIVGTPISVTRQQFRQHLQEMIAFMRDSNDTQICITEKGVEAMSFSGKYIHPTCWCKRNLWYMVMSNDQPITPIFSLEGAVCSVMSSLYEDWFEKVDGVFKEKNVCIRSVEKILDKNL